MFEKFMFEKWYKILGLTRELYESWKEDLREDIIVYEENGNIEARILLNPFEAIYLNILMEDNNKKQNDYKLELVSA